MWVLFWDNQICALNYPLGFDLRAKSRSRAQYNPTRTYCEHIFTTPRHRKLPSIFVHLISLPADNMWKELQQVWHNIHSVLYYEIATNVAKYAIGLYIMN